MERETGIEPATNSLEGCDSTTELLPPVFVFNNFTVGCCTICVQMEAKGGTLHKVCIKRTSHCINAQNPLLLPLRILFGVSILLDQPL